MQYYEADDKVRRLWGIAGVLLYVGLCVGVMFIPYSIEMPETELGILVDFGTADHAGGTIDLMVSEIDTRPVTPSQSNDRTEEVITTEDHTAPTVEQTPNTQTTPAKPVEQTTPEREVNKKALFPGRTEGSNSTSQGSSEGTGNQGIKDGAPERSTSESGASTNSSGFTLSGRYMVGEFPRPIYNADAEGRVVVRITVDSEGRVTNAVYEQAGSTTNRGELVEAARKAAMRAKFTPSETDLQTGTITYIFRLN
jgi:TonB family protein